MGTGLIYVAIVAAWAAYLVPLLVRRHEEVAAEPTMDSGAPAASHPGPGPRVLARRPPVQGSSVGRGSSVEEGNGPSPVGTDDLERPGPSPAVRRRRILLGLVVLTAATGILSVLGLASWWTLSLPSGAVVVFLSSSVRVARGARSVRAERRERAHHEPAARHHWRDSMPDSTMSPAPIPSARTARVDPARADGSAPAAPAASARVPMDTTTGTKSEVVAGAGLDPRLGSPSDEAVAGSPAAREDGWWDPVHVPLPTYVTKAKAPRTVRTVDLGLQGTWTGGRLPESELLVRPDDSAAMLLDEREPGPPARGDQDAGAKSDGEESEHRRAVGD